MGNQRLIFVLVALAVNYLLFQSILVPYGNGKPPWSSRHEISLHSTPNHFTIRNPLIRDASEDFNAMVEKMNIPIINDESGHGNQLKSVSAFGVSRDDFQSLPEKKNVGKNNSLELDNVGSKKSFIAVLAKDSKVDFSVKQFLVTKRGVSTISQMVKSKHVDSREHDHTTSSTNLTHLENSPQKNKKCNMPPKSRMLIQEMNHILERRRVSSRAMVLLSLSIMKLLYGQVIVVDFFFLVISIWSFYF